MPRKKWGHSSVGRALEWHSRGRRFDPDWLHHISSYNLFHVKHRSDSPSDSVASSVRFIGDATASPPAVFRS